MRNTLRLLADARDGSRTSFDLLFERHRGRLTAFAASRMGPALRGFVEPEDIVQETYLEAARKIDDFEAREPQGFYRWLVRIAGFKVKEANRRRTAKKRGAPAALLSDPPAGQTSVAGRVGRSEQATVIADALSTLSDAQAEAVRLRYLGGLSVAETAERMERSESAVKSLVARGLKDLALRLGTGS